MSNERRRGLGKGLGALIPSAPAGDRPSDVFFPRHEQGFTGNRADQPGRGEGENDHGVDDHREDDHRESIPDQASRPAAHRQDDAIDPRVLSSSTTPSGSPQAASSDLSPVPGAVFAEIPVDQIRANPRQPRQVFDEDDLAELVASITELGVLQPIVVRPLLAESGGDSSADSGGKSGGKGASYELVMGERRLRASTLAGKDTIPAIVRSTEDEHMLRDALLENLHRAQLNPLEEAAAYEQLLQDFGCTHEELASRIGRSRPQISNTIRLLKLPPLVQRRVASGVLSAGHARALLGLPDGAAMERLAQRIVAEGLSVRSVEEIVVLGGDGAKEARRPRARTEQPEHLERVAQDLAQRLETRVQVVMGKRKGRITVDFAGADDLERILDALGRSDQGQAH
ncbi:ParB/RepB/Spo0J family partition protein [Ornithinimicrobium sp. Y1694]|uniref:ParB/RepB/Spo0J family partition protein n=1 Tax=Ornithinimicrobium sp. Y1694 TaxID=3418590 RepID=UPI003CFB243D